MRTEIEISLRDAVKAQSEIKYVESIYPDETGWEDSNVFVIETLDNENDDDLHQDIKTEVVTALFGIEYWITSTIKSE